MNAMKYWFTCILVVVCMMELPAWQSADRLIPQLGKITIDGRLNDWSVPFYKNDLTKAGRADFHGPDDFSIEYALAQSGDDLLIAIRWSDDVLDSRYIPRDSARWRHPTTGNAMDRMYLYDGIKLQLQTDSLQYEAWLAPTVVANGSPVQWETRGPRNNRVAVNLMEANSVKDSNGVYTLEMRLNLMALAGQLPIEKPQVSWVMIDQDSPEAALASKLETLVYFHGRSSYFFN